MIKGENLSFHYPGGSELFEDLGFSLEEGGTMAILGPNGAGKTTFIKCLMGFLSYTTGQVSIDGMASSSRREFWKMVGYVPQARSTAFGFSVLEMVTMGLSTAIQIGRKPSRRHYELALQTLEELGLSQLRDASCNRISGGQLQMVLIGRALIKRPRILIMDEPESHLDLKNQMKILNLIERLNADRDMTVIINTHFPQHALQIARDTLVISQRGHLFGRTREILTERTMADYFGIQCEMVRVDRAQKEYTAILPICLSTQ